MQHLDGFFKLRNQIDYRALPAQANQNVLHMLYRDWKSFFAALADYKAHPDKYEAIPHIPRYADKNGYKPLIFTNQICKLRKDKHGWYVKFPKAVLQAGCVRDRYDLGKMDLHEQKLKEVRLIPNGDTIKLEIVCEIEIKEPTITIHEATRVAGIDIGVDNLMAIAFTSGHHPVLIKGNEIKAVNQFYNKQIAHYRSLLRTGKKDSKGIHQTKRMKRISEKRNRRVKDILHKASRKIIDLCVEEGIEVIVVGNHAGWKKRIHMGKKNNQTFVQIPFHTLIEMIKYKGEAAGIRVVVCEEAIQSKASSIDEDQIPVYGNDVAHTFTGKRIKRGLYRSKNGILMNADINGASNIIRKVYPCMPERERWSRGTVNVPVTCI